MNKKIIALLIVSLLSSCTIGDYEFKKIEEEKQIEKVSNEEILQQIKDFKEEIVEIRRLKEEEIKLKEKISKKFEKKLTSEEIEMKLLEEENKKLEKENKKIDVDIQKDLKEKKLKTGEFCLFDTCLYKKNIEVEGLGKVSDIFAGKDYFYSFIGKDCKQEDFEKNNKKCVIVSKMSKNKTFLEKIIFSGKKTEKLYINYFLNFFVKTLVTKENNDMSVIQNIFDKTGKKLDILEAKKIFLDKYNLLADTIKIGKIDYKININLKKISPVFNEKNTLFLNDRDYINSKIIALKLTNLALNEKYLYKNYIFQVSKEKQIFVMYSSDLKQSERIVNLGTDKNWLDENISSSGEILDKELSEKIVGYYGLKTKKALFNIKKERIFSISGDDFPIFKVKKFNDKGNYILLLKDGFYTK